MEASGPKYQHTAVTGWPAAISAWLLHPDSISLSNFDFRPSHQDARTARLRQDHSGHHRRPADARARGALFTAKRRHVSPSNDCLVSLQNKEDDNADRSVRKEIKIRPGFTPQEDVGRFRTARQAAAETLPTYIPGTSRVKPQAPKEDNPFAQLKNEKTKAQLKNEKRKEKRALAKVGEKAWDEEDEEDEDGGKDLREAFEKVDLDDGEPGEETDGAKVGASSVDQQGAATVPTAASTEDDGSGRRAAEMDLFDGPDDEAPAKPAPTKPSATPSAPPALAPPVDPSPATSTPAAASSSKASGPAWRTKPPKAPMGDPNNGPKPSAANGKPTAKPHPIQGGRKGPIGLAHPPPVPANPVKQPPRPSKSVPGAKAGGRPAPRAETPPAERVRKEVKVREGGTTDRSSLASRVRGLVIANAAQSTPGGRRKAAEEQPAAST